MSEDIEPHVLDKFEIVEKLGRGNYGIVWKAIHRKHKKVVVIKKIYDAFLNTTDAKRTLREVLYHQEFSDHENIIDLYHVIKSHNGKDLYLVLDYIEADLHHVIRAKILTLDHIRFVTTQILRALKYLHSGGVIHRDIKPANILIDSDCLIKLIDFGLARSVRPDQVTKVPPIMTEYVATRWYRAPEILLGSKTYTEAVDMWALGCVLGEMFAGKPLFPGTSTLNQIQRILEFTGGPSAEDIEDIDSPLASDILSTLEFNKSRSLNGYFPMVESSDLDFIKGLLQFNPAKRMTVEQALRHRFLEHFPDDLRADHSEDKVKIGPVLISIDEGKGLTPAYYRDTLYSEIRKRRKLKKIKVTQTASSVTSEQMLLASPGGTNARDGDRSSVNWSIGSPTNVQSRLLASFSPRPSEVGNSMIKNLQPSPSKANISVFAHSTTKEKPTPPTSSLFKKLANEVRLFGKNDDK